MFFKQIKEKGDNFTYIIADDSTWEAVVVDPSFNEKAIIKMAKEFNLDIKYIINTHHHRDHTSGNNKIASSFGAKVVAHSLSRVEKDLVVSDGDTLTVGGISIKVIHTPGHSPDSICLLVDEKLLTGDTLFIGECGRTDTADGNSRDMYQSLFNKLMKLEDDLEVFPGHDYGPKPHSSLGEEKKTNYTLEKRTLEEFIEFMKE